MGGFNFYEKRIIDRFLTIKINEKTIISKTIVFFNELKVILKI